MANSPGTILLSLNRIFEILLISGFYTFYIFSTLIFVNRNLITMYIIKVRGKKKIPDYIQIRDDDFALVGYFSYRPGRPFTRLEKFGLEGKEKELEKLVEKLPFGKLQKLEL